MNKNILKFRKNKQICNNKFNASTDFKNNKQISIIEKYTTKKRKIHNPNNYFTDQNSNDSTLSIVIVLVLGVKLVFCSFACTALCYRLVEQKLNKFINKFKKKILRIYFN